MALLLSISAILLIGFVQTRHHHHHHHKHPVRQERYYDQARDAFNNGAYDFDVNSKKGPKHWCEKYPRCSGKEQSPIDIITKKVRCDDKLTDFTYDGYDTVLSMPFLINRCFDDFWQVSVFEYEGGDVFIEGAWLPHKFSLYSIYFWAGPGSMHQVDGNEYSLQIGLFHWNCQKYSSYIEAENNPDGVVHLSVFVQADDERSTDPQNKAFSDAFENVIDGAQQKIRCFMSFPISSLLPSADCRVYYKYHGSYYGPPCHESITYAVFKQPVYITHDQLERYRKVFASSGAPAKNNGRPIQPLNGRIVSKLC